MCRGILGCLWCILRQKQLRLSWKVDEGKPLGDGAGGSSTGAGAGAGGDGPKPGLSWLTKHVKNIGWGRA